MGQFSKWLLHEDQKEWFDYLFALVLNIVFLALTALLLWPLGEATVALRLAKGYWVFWTVVIAASMVMVLAQRIFRMDLYERFDAYVISGLALSAFLQLGWSAFAALVIRSAGRRYVLSGGDNSVRSRRRCVLRRVGDRRRVLHGLAVSPG
jgi:hypothetical protein